MLFLFLSPLVNCICNKLYLQSSDPAQLENALEAALEAHYPLIDTALSYGNERGIGDFLKKRMEEGKLKREDIFVTTKVYFWISCWQNQVNIDSYLKNLMIDSTFWL